MEHEIHKTGVFQEKNRNKKTLIQSLNDSMYTNIMLTANKPILKSHEIVHITTFKKLICVEEYNAIRK